MSTPGPESWDANASSAIAQRAAEWLVLRDRGFTPTQQEEFERWLEADERHHEAYAELEETWACFNRLCHQPPTVLERFRVEAKPVARRRRFAWMATSLAAAAALALAFASWSHSRASSPFYTTVAVTEVGGMQKLILPDGSVVQLNTDTAVSVRFTAAERRVELQRGEAHFQVAKNPACPFIVSASGVAVRAVGTAFNVRMRPTAVDVLVTEGKVRVDDAAKGNSLLSANRGGEPLLVAGQRTSVSLRATVATAAPVKIVPVASAEIGQALAWQSRRLEFVATPLVEIVAEFNRYNRHKLVIPDDRLAAQRFGGTFPANDFEEFVRVLESDFGVVVERGEHETKLRLKR
jgi:transmembrane sensor